MLLYYNGLLQKESLLKYKGKKINVNDNNNNVDGLKSP